MSLHVCPGDFLFYFGQPFGHFGERNWLSVCNVLIVVPLLWVRLSFPFAS